MRERADGNEIHAGPGNRADVRQVHAAAGLGLHAAFDFLHRQPQLNRVHVIEQDNVRPRIGGLLDLFQGVRFDLDFEIRIFFPRALDGGGDGIRFFAVQCGKVIVLDEHHIEQAEAMVVSAAARDGVFLETPPAGRGFARVQNLRVSSFDGLDELRGQRGDAGKPLDEIQRDALGAQNGAGRAGNFQQRFHPPWRVGRLERGVQF